MAMTMRERIAARIQETCARPNMHIEIALHVADAVLAELETPTDGVIEAHAKCEATEWDKRPFEQLGRADRERYAKRSSAAFTAAIRAAREGK